jgi:hypothetical protein
MCKVGGTLYVPLLETSRWGFHSLAIPHEHFPDIPPSFRGIIYYAMFRIALTDEATEHEQTEQRSGGMSLSISTGV